MKRMKMMPLLLALALAGCGSLFSGSAMRDSDQRAAAIFADCDAQLRSGRLKSNRQAVDCARPRVLAAYQENGYPYMDLVNFDLAARASGAELIDTGFSTEADVKRDVAELERRIAAERERRLGVTTWTGASPPLIPPERLLAGLDALTGRTFPRSGSADCFQLGKVTRCQ